MPALPSDLLRSHRDCLRRRRERRRRLTERRGVGGGDGDGDDDDDDMAEPQDVLAELLHSLLCLPDDDDDPRPSSSPPFSSEKVEGEISFLRSCLSVEGDDDDGDGRNEIAFDDDDDDRDREWRDGLALVRTLLRPSSSSDDDLETLSPHELLMMTSGCSVEIPYEDEGGGEQPKGGGKSRMRMVCALLGSLSIEIAASEAASYLLYGDGPDEGKVAKVPWKRFRNMAEHNLSLFYRLYLVRPCRRDRVEATAILFSDVVAPSTSRMIGVFLDASDAGVARALTASLVGVATRCASLLGSRSDLPEGRCDAAMGRIVRCVCHSMPFIRMDEILVHPIRRFFHERSEKRTRNDRSSSDAEDDGAAAADDAAADDEEEESSIERHRKVRNDRDFTYLACDGSRFLGPMSRWDVRGVAHLACALTLDAVSSSSSNAEEGGGRLLLLPRVYGPDRLWTLLFPHVANLLLPSDDPTDGYDDDDSPTGDDASEDANLRNAIRAVRMLRSIMMIVPTNSTPRPPSTSLLAAATTARRNSKVGRNADDDDPDPSDPLCPAGAAQLLLNLAMDAPSQADDVDPNDDDGRPVVPSASEVLSLVRTLLSRYDPTTRARCAKVLAERCPYPALLPTILDLFRPAIVDASSSSSSEADDDDGGSWDAVVETTLDVADGFVREMTERVGWCDDARSNKDGEAAGEQLTERTEIYSSAAGLVRLLLLRWKSVDDGSTSTPLRRRLDKIADELGAIRRRLVALLERWSSETEGFGTVEKKTIAPAPPEDYYRLYLLEDALAEVVRSSS